MKIKTCDATKLQLNWLVAKVEGLVRTCTHNKALPPYSTDWAYGGPIIEREKIVVMCPSTGDFWDARLHTYPPEYVRGPTPLFAAMRCYVASKLGGEVDVPDEL